MSRRRSLVALFLMLAMLLSYIPAQAEDANVIEVSHSPDVPKSGEAVDITLKFDDATNISNVKIIYCKFDPIQCEFPQEMDQSTTDNNVFTYSILKEYDAGTKVGFKFKINETGNIWDFPESTSDQNIHPFEGPYQGSYYHIYTLEAKPQVDSNWYLIVVIVLIVAIMPLIAGILLWMKKRKGRKDEDEK
ncbi:MAG: hypothetical protein JSV09_05990 [Thermoplasmata archaeon]|nr:MAG: hypothetical protein JSV09_05990 [Thermoplasmata archaeon]